MLAFWEKLTFPLLNHVKPKRIIEIGSLYGEHSNYLLQYCQSADAELLVIDPAPQFDLTTFKNLYGDHIQLRKDYSLNVLPTLQEYQFVIIDGDHNWYTVYHELKEIEKMANKSGHFPVVLLHDTGWPYGRRDMYYFPDSIPAEHRKPFMQKGIECGRSELVDFGGTNSHLNHAVYENGEQNGVFTAVEDFLDETELNLTFNNVGSHHGLGIIHPKEYDDVVFQLVIHSGL